MSDKKDYTVKEKGEIQLAGITMRIDNSQEGVAKIPQLWQQFYQGGVIEKIGEQAKENVVFESYFDYEGDATGEYTIMLGTEVKAKGQLEEGLSYKVLPAAKYAVFTVADAQSIPKKWAEIWARNDLDRTYSGDFEIIRGENEAIEIYVAIQN